MEIQSQIRTVLVEALAKGRIPYVLQQLSELNLDKEGRSQLTIVQSQHQRLRQQLVSGLVSAKEAQIRENQITSNLLQLLDGLGSPALAPTEEAIQRQKSSSIWQYLVASGVVIGIVSAVLTLLDFPWANFFAPPSNSITILVHGPKGRDQLVLPGRGEVRLIYGNAVVSKITNQEGEATFQQVPASFFEQQARVEVHFSDPEGEPYRAVHFDSLYPLQQGKYLALEVVLLHLDRLKGRVQDFRSNQPIDSVRVVSNGLEAFSDSHGEFTLHFPPASQQQFQNIHASKPGYQPYELHHIPVQTQQEISIPLKPNAP